jgi:gamma-glutamylcyclotransferase (GGCT)/AIG2-like uncharacterized protein YtfP
MSILNFAWGSHVNIDQYREIINGEPITRRLAILRDFRLTSSQLVKFPIEQKDLAGDGGGPRLVKDSESTVYGVLYEISEEQWATLDSYEFAWGFEAIEVPVVLNDGSIENAQIHNLILHGDFLPTSESFIRVMKVGLEELEYSDEIINLTIDSLKDPH